MNSAWRTALAVAFAGLIALRAGPALGEELLRFEEAWVRALPPGMKMTAAFGRLQNRSGRQIELTQFSSPQFGDVSLHRSETIDGVSRMREVDSLPLAAGEMVELEPGGLHLMLMMPIAASPVGETVVLVMTSSGGESFRFEVPVERR
jgi:copper(I)-binding protein